MALDFAGSATDRVDHGSGVTLDDLNPFTFIEWVYPQAAVNARVIGFTKDSGSQKTLAYSGTGGHVNAFVPRATTDSNYITNSGGLTINAWNLLAWVFNTGAGAGEVTNIYIGSLTTPAAEAGYGTAIDGEGAVTSDAAVSFILGNRAAASRSGDAIFAVATYCNAALTLAQIQSWQFRPRKLASSVLFCHYGFNGTGTQPDLSGNGNNGTVTGAVVADHVPLGPPFGFAEEWQGAFGVAAAPSEEFSTRHYPRGAMRGVMRGAA